MFWEETVSRHREHLFRRIAWRLQALAEGDLSDRARGRAHQIAQDADLRKIAPRDFFTVGGERVEVTRGNRSRREQDNRLPQPGTMLSRKWKGGTILVEVLAKDFGMTTGIIRHSVIGIWVDDVSTRVGIGQ